MKISRSVSLFATLSILASALVGINVANAAGNPNCSAVDGDYIVSFAPGANVDSEIKGAPGRAIALKYRYKFALNGFAANLSAEQVCALEKRPNIKNVELDGIVSIDQIDDPAASWGLDRIDDATLVKDNTYSFSTTGAGVTAYVIDTGIQITHPDFANSLLQGFSSIRGGVEDCNGHGTHVAGTIGGDLYGVAKEVQIVPIRVLDCRGSGQISGVIAGVDWVTANFKNNGLYAVANMSLGGGTSASLDTSVKNLINAGVTVVVAAGNSSANVSTSSPARVLEAITVAASDSTDTFAYFSNYGSSIDVIAPGVAITSDWLISKTNPKGVKTIDGTSMASPHVAGAIARYLQTLKDANKSAPSKGLNIVPSGWSQTGQVKETAKVLLNGTPNLLIYADPTK